MSPPLDDDHVERLAEVFRALSDPARLRILGAIAEQTRSGSELSEMLRPFASDHQPPHRQIGGRRTHRNDAGRPEAPLFPQYRHPAITGAIIRPAERSSSGF